MGRVLTNNVSLAYTIETALGVAGTTWFFVEPNAINTFGADITTVARDPISKNRQRRKGTVTDLDSVVEFEEDLTLSSFRDFLEGFAFVTGVNSDVTQLSATGAETTGDTYTGLTALSAAQADKFEIDTLIQVDGFVNAANNGLKVLDTDAVATDTDLAVAENLVDESGATAQISFAGHRVATGDVVTWDWDASAKEASLLMTGLGTELIALGLTAGQLAHIGSPDGSGGVQNAFENSAANDMFGYVRVVSLAADVVVFDKVDAALQFDDLTDPATAVDVLFGEFIRNVPVDDAAYLERSFQFEAAWPNLQQPDGTGDEYEYAIGNFCNTLAFNMPLTDKATITFGFVGQDTEDPVTAQKTGADSATDPTETAAFNTSADIARLRITEVDEDGLTTDFKSLTVTLNNNVTPEKVLGQLGAKFLNTGNFEVDVEAQLLFTDSDVTKKIRANETVTMDFIVTNDDGAIAIDIPAMTLGGGGKELPVNESVLLNTTGLAFQDPLLNTSIGISIFPVVP